MGLIPEETIAQVLERTDIVQLISSYLPLKRAGRNYKANCPFHHEKTPSFMVNPDKQIFHCFGCGEGGNAISFVMKQEHVEFPEALRRMAQRVGIVIPEEVYEKKSGDLRQAIYKINGLASQFFHHHLMTSREATVQEVRDYLKQRGVSVEILEKFKIGFAPDEWDALLRHLQKKEIGLHLMEKAGLIIAKENQKGFYDRFRSRITFPIFDIKSQCVGFGARALQDGVAKYINSPETPVYTKGHHLYGFHLAKEAVSRQDNVVVVEGYMDFIMPFQAGVNNVVASLGTALTTEQIRLLRRYTRNVIMLFDTDAAGQSAMVRSLDLLIEEGMNVRVVTLTEDDDPDSFIRKFGVEVFEKRLTQAVNLFDYKLGSLTKRFDAKSIEGRAAISQDMLTTISKFDNAILQSEYIKRLAQTLFLAEEALLIEMKKVAVAASSEMTEAVSIPKEQPRVVERNILKLMLEDESFIPKVKEDVEVVDFRDENIRHILKEIFRLFEQGAPITPMNLINSLTERRAREIISALTVEGEMVVTEKEKMYRDCVDRLINERLKSQRQELLEKIRLAEMAGDESVLHQLKQRFNDLVKNRG